MRKLWALITSVGAIFLLPAPQHAAALSCIEGSWKVGYAIEHADAIFAGKLINIEGNEVAPDIYTWSDNFKATFEVSQVWKGKVSRATVVDLQLYPWSSTSPAFTQGNEYLIYADVIEGASALRVGIDCTRNPRLLSSAQEDLAVLGKGMPPGDASPPLLSFLLTKDLTVGSKGADVVLLQTFLERSNRLVMPSGVAKGYFGPLTRAALAKYQAGAGISPAHGYFGPITRRHLEDIRAVAY